MDQAFIINAEFVFGYVWHLSSRAERQIYTQALADQALRVNLHHKISAEMW